MTRRRAGRGVVTAIAVAVATVAAACATGDAPEGVLRIAIVEPASIDPYNAVETEGLLVTDHLFTGLLKLDAQTGELAPGVATDWEGDETCTRWTFLLRDDTTFTNGEPVTAESFIRGWTRAVAAEAASDAAHHLSGVAGYDELHGTEDQPQGTTDIFAGLSAPDPHTFVVDLAEPDCELDAKMLLAVTYPAPEAAGGHDNQAYNEMPIGNGPFMMAEPWQRGSSITLVRNDGYFGDVPALDEVRITILSGEDAFEQEYRGFQAGRFDVARVPAPLLPQAQQEYADELVRTDGPSVNFLLPANHNPPLDSPDARKAVSLAIDRAAIVEGPLQNAHTVADAFIPPPFAAHQAGVCDACVFDPDRARTHAQAADLEPGTRLEFLVIAEGPDGVWAQAVGDMLSEHLQLDVVILSVPFAEFLERAGGEDFAGMGAIGWVADYPTPDNFLGPLMSARSLPPGNNFARYENPAVDALLDRARAALDPAERIEAFREAERVAIGEDLAYIPLWYPADVRVFDTQRFTGVAVTFAGNLDLTAIRPRT